MQMLHCQYTTTKTSPAKIGCNNTLTKPKRSGPSLPARSSSQTHNVPDATEFCNPKPGAEWTWCKSCKKQFRIRRRQHTSEAHTSHPEDRRVRGKLFQPEQPPCSSCFDFASQYRICGRLFDTFMGFLEPDELHTLAETEYKAWARFVVAVEEKLLVIEDYWDTMRESRFSD